MEYSKLSQVQWQTPVRLFVEGLLTALSGLSLPPVGEQRFEVSVELDTDSSIS